MPELVDLAESPLASAAWRLQNLYAIKPKEGRPQKFRPNRVQREFYNAQWYCNHILKARQMGLSTFICMQNLDAMLFKPHTTVGVVDYKMDDAKKKLAMMRLAYELMDDPAVHPDTWELGRLIKTAVGMEAKGQELALGNGSSAYCGTSLRGGTVQRLHISEFGKMAFKRPKDAVEIQSGALNTVAPGQVINIESTHEGGKSGLHYKLLQNAMRVTGGELTEVDFKFHFFPWFLDPAYRIDRPGMALRPETVRYFEKLREDEGIVCDEAQMLWYDRKEPTQGFGMWKEFPSTPGEAMNAIVEGAIYGTQIASLRAKGRVCSFEPDANAPLYTSFDIGGSDSTAMWLVQPVGREFLWLDWYEASREEAGHYADKIREWEGRYGHRIAAHFLPHDAMSRERWNNHSPYTLLRDAGVDNIVVVPRTTDVWVGIGTLRGMLPNSWFHTNCDRKPVVNGDELPSGLDHLEAYRCKTADTGATVREMPVHDHSSHTSDAARTFAEALKLNLTPGGGARVVRNRRG